jgi:DNA-binding CsgD family transcriptional regulator
VEFAVRNPDKVSSLILYGGIARGWAKSGHPPEANEALATLIRSGWESDNPAFRQVFTSQFMPDATKEQMDSFNELSRLSTSAQNAVRFQYEVGQIDIISRLPQVRCPTIVCHCRHDARVPFAQGQQIAELIPGATLVPLEGRNHIILEAEVAWSDFVQAFRGFTGSAFSAEAPGATMEPSLAAAESAKLSPREVEVLRLIVLGRSDREIASELVLSIKTVGNHVGSILTKTDTPNRTAAAFYATRHGII